MGRLRLTAGILLVVLASCTSASPDANDATPSPGSTGTVASTELPTASPSPSFAEGDDVLDVAIAEPSTLDPMRIGDPGSVLVARQLYEGLTSWDPVEHEVVGAGAEFWDIADGGKTFTFHLRGGMTFHDGAPVTAKDFVFAFDRIAQKKNGSPVAYTLEKVKGFSAVNQLGDSDHLSGLEAPDDLTLVVRLTEPFIELPTILTHPALVPLEETAVADLANFLRMPVGNGAFQIMSPWSPGGEVVLKRFDGFIRTSALEGIRFLPFKDAATSWLRFVSGDFDIAEVPAGQIKAASRRFGETGYVPLMATYGFGLNLKAPNLGDRNVRLAISLAIDRDAISQRAYKGTMLPPRGVVPEGMPGFKGNACRGICEYDAARAQQLVAGLDPDQRKIELDHTEGSPHVKVARLVTGDLEAAGFNVTRRAFDFERYVELLQEGELDVYRLGWIAEYPTPDAFLGSLFGSNSADNHSGFASAVVDNLLRRARSTADANERTKLYRRAEALILKGVPFAPIGSFVTHWAAQSWVEDVAFDESGGFDAVTVHITEEE